jgi:hypothetical protein
VVIKGFLEHCFRALAIDCEDDDQFPTELRCRDADGISLLQGSGLIFCEYDHGYLLKGL